MVDKYFTSSLRKTACVYACLSSFPRKNANIFQNPGAWPKNQKKTSFGAVTIQISPPPLNDYLEQG